MTFLALDNIKFYAQCFIYQVKRSIIVVNKTTLFMLLEASPFNLELSLATHFYIKVRGLYRIISRFFSNSTRLSLWLFWDILNVWNQGRCGGDILLELLFKAVLFKLKAHWQFSIFFTLLVSQYSAWGRACA